MKMVTTVTNGGCVICYHRQVIKELVWSEITYPPHHRLFGPTVEILFKLS